MRKLFAFVVIFFSVFSIAVSQEDPQYTLNFYNQLSYNPGYAGSNDAICGVMLYRNQWMGFEGAPKTYALTVQGPVESISSGLGLSFVRDEIGYFSDHYVTLNYAYRFELGNGKLGLGLGLGIIQKALSLNGDNWITTDVLQGKYQDPYSDLTVPQDQSRVSFDSNFGAYYLGANGNDSYYGGLSLTHLNKPSYKLDKDNSDANHSYYARHLYLAAGYSYQMNKKVDIQPAFIMHTDGASAQFNISARVIYLGQMWGGLCYRNGDAISPMVGYNHPSGLGGGIAYDISLSKLSSYNSGTIELYVRYCFNLEFDKSRGSYKSVRFL